MQVLYVSVLCSQNAVDTIFRDTGSNPGFAVQKFHRLVCQGLVANGASVRALSAYPISFQTNKKILFSKDSEIESGVKIVYSTFLNLPILRHICLLLSAFFNTIIWGVGNRKSKVVICDVLNISVCLGALLASKIVGVRCVGVVTDMPGLMVNTQKQGLISRIVAIVNKSYLSRFTHYVFLTRQMNDVINSRNRPYIVMEGLVDVSAQQNKCAVKSVDDKRIIMYAGGLHEKYGLKMLVDAFMRLQGDELCLALYGSGPMESYIKECALKDTRVCFYGVRSNEEVVAAELKATLLVNPRPTNEEFTQYSFPSKNMEYMVSGTPLLTTALPGMPKEYYPYVYIFDNETVDGYFAILNKLMSYSSEELREKGEQAKLFVLTKKNNNAQAKRILESLK